jgi:homoserine kinase
MTYRRMVRDEVPMESKSLKLILPATSANLGPAFDAAAVALNFCLTLQAQVSRKFTITAVGRDAQICANPRANLILETYKEIMELEGTRIKPLALRITNEIPIGKGCGSSAAARLAGIALAVHFGDLSWSDRQIIEEACKREQHPDNAVACWMGGLTLCRFVSGKSVEAVRVKTTGKWPLILAVPRESLATERARQLLPAKYLRADVVANIKNCFFLLAAITQGRSDLLRPALTDYMHQPYRSSLCPLLLPLQKTGMAGIVGAVLSGAGPSVLVFLDPAVPVNTSVANVQKCLSKRGLSAELICTAISVKGARRDGRWRRRAA